MGAAGVAGAYGLYQYGVPYIGNLLATKAPGIVSAAKALFTADAAAQGTGTSAAPTSENMYYALSKLHDIGDDDPELFSKIYDLIKSSKAGSGYKRKKGVKRRTKRH